MDIEREYDKLYRYCRRRLGSREQAEDVTQEAFARYFAGGPPGEGRALRWLYVTARNLCADEYRRRKPEPLPPDLPAPDTSLEDLALRQALARLTAEEQELILMRYVNQERVSAVAAATGMSRFAVYRRTAAALEKLRRALEEDEP